MSGDGDEKIRRYEALLKQHGIDVVEDLMSQQANGSWDVPTFGDPFSHYRPETHVPRRSGQSWTGQDLHRLGHTGRIRLWQDIHDLQEDEQYESETSDEAMTGNPQTLSTGLGDGSDLILGISLTAPDLRLPGPGSSARLWQIYQDNVNPLNKLLHVPTTQKLMVEAIDTPSALTSERMALLFAIFAAAVTSLDETVSRMQCLSCF